MARGIIRKPSFNKIVGAYRSQWKRFWMRLFTAGAYGSKGMGWLTNPKKAWYNFWYSRTSVSIYQLLGCKPSRGACFFGMFCAAAISIFAAPIDATRAGVSVHKAKKSRAKSMSFSSSGTRTFGTGSLGESSSGAYSWGAGASYSFSDRISTGEYSGRESTGEYSGRISTGEYSGRESTGEYSGRISTGEYSGRESTGEYSGRVSTGEYSGRESMGEYSGRESTEESSDSVLAENYSESTSAISKATSSEPSNSSSNSGSPQTTTSNSMKRKKSRKSAVIARTPPPDLTVKEMPEGSCPASIPSQKSKAASVVPHETKVPEQPDENAPKSKPMNEGDQYIRKRMVIAGSFYCDQAVISQLSVGSYLQLCAEPENLYDKNAVALYCQGSKIGYIAKCDVIPFATNLKLGTSIYGVVTDIRDKDGRKEIEYETWFLNKTNS